MKKFILKAIQLIILILFCIKLPFIGIFILLAHLHKKS
jgi:hypothetical protein